MRFCTLASIFELPHARALAERIAEHHPDSPLTVLVTGRPRMRNQEPFLVLTPSDLGIREQQDLERRYEHADLDYLYRPHLLHRLLNDGSGPLVFLHPAHELFAPLEPVAQLLESHPVVLSPRVVGDLPEDLRQPSGDDLRAQGRIDPGFVAVRPSEDAERFISWWAERATELIPYLDGTRGVGRPEQGRRQLRRVLDLAPSLFRYVAELEDAGCEVSAWNMHERPLVDRAAAMLAGGRTLRSMSLVDFQPDRPHLLSDRATRVTPAQDPLLRTIMESYADRLQRHGWRDLPRRSEVGRRLANGVVFSDRLLRLHAQALAEGQDLGDPFSPAGTAAFMAWLKEPTGPGAQAGISRYLYQAYRDRPDLPVAYPDLSSRDGPDFVGWAWVFGRRELEIPEDFLPPPPPGLGITANGTASIGVNVAGYFTGTLGLGEAARLYVAALRAGGVPVRTTTVDAALPVDRQAKDRGYGKLAFDNLDDRADTNVNLICVNAEELPRFAADTGPEFFAGRHNIGVWAWETDVIPARWDQAFGYVDEIWVYSRYIAENLGRVSPVPVVPVPPPVTPPPPSPAPDLGLPDGFRFMFMFDFFSTVKRKNPVGVIDAFKRAFAPGEGPHLVIKTIHADYRRASYEELAFAARDRPDIYVIDDSLSVADKNGLLESCDCYVSLHRSEGYGLPLAECMAMGKPVIATAYSGNLDFMGPGNSYLVDYTLTHVGGDVEIYPAEGTWAEPSIEHAAAQMRGVWENQEEARRRGERARADIAEQLNPGRVGAIARDRLTHLAAAAGRSLSGEGAALHELEAWLATDRPAPSAGPRGARGLARRAVLRLLRPFTAEERVIDRALARALRELSGEVAAQRRELAALRERDGQE
jgi:glycosyltransferase involved in cell wall biosynthesis